MTSVPSVVMRVYPDDCDAFGHVNQAAFLRMFERARWEVLAVGPGMEAFRRSKTWPAVRKSTVEYTAEAFPGDVLQYDTTLTHLGRTSFSLHQTARREADGVIVAEADSVFVCVGETGRPSAVPVEIRNFFGTRPSVRAGAVQHLLVRDVATAVDVQGDGPAILFVHGFPLDRTMWRHLVAPLTGWQRIAPDLRGMGLSDVPQSGRYSMAEYADDLAALLAKREVEETVICGLSMGGYIALEFVRRYRSMVRALILTNTRAEADTPEGKAGRDEMAQLVEREGAGALADVLLPKLLSPSSLSAMPQVVEHVRTMITGSPVAGLIGALTAMKDRPDSTPSLQQIDVPTLVVTGREDLLIPVEHSRTMADAIPGAQCTVIPEAGHLTPMEQPIATSRVIGEFLEALG
ncbi:MAG: alpha/beta fold hydrolase [Gemmatimonadota bacterium]|nr:MAG: alpha/beta fold hydrolase [Gemmatimonadota bacterium]